MKIMSYREYGSNRCVDVYTCPDPKAAELLSIAEKIYDIFRKHVHYEEGKGLVILSVKVKPREVLDQEEIKIIKERWSEFDENAEYDAHELAYAIASLTPCEYDHSLGTYIKVERYVCPDVDDP